jgi:iron complex transport system ATP-binding protein
MRLSVENVSFEYPDGFRLQGIDLNVPGGSFLGLIGPNGSGKSTLLKLMCGSLAPASGRILLEGIPIDEHRPRERARRMAVISAEQHFDFPFLVRDVVAMGRFPHTRRVARAHEHDREIITSVLSLTDLLHLQDRPISHLSSGERQRALIARALAQEPSVLLLDEPDTHLDLHHQLNVFRLLTRLNRERSMTIVVVLHDLTAAAAFCRELALLDKGIMVRHGAPEEVVSPDTIAGVYGPGVIVCPNPVTSGPMVTIAGQATEGPTGE